VRAESVKIIRISESHVLANDRWLYHVLEHLDTFTLLECRGRREVCLRDITHTLILDHLDEAESPTEILNQVMSASCEIKTLVVVASEPEADISGIGFDLHIAMRQDLDCLESIGAVCVNDLGMAVNLVKDSLVKAA
tara:strand:- start:4222 stop:4632 length:411 start_codon:yes stop_codon:yes gene_type:complete